MSGSNGSAELTPKQGKWFRKKFGVTYLRVQTNSDMLSRRDRRALGQRQRLYGQGLRVIHARYAPGGSFFKAAA